MSTSNHYIKPIKAEPHNILEPDRYMCRECGESRINQLEINVVIDSTNCTVYQIFCNVCAKYTLAEVLCAAVRNGLERLNTEGETIHQVSNVRSALSGRVLDRKRISAGEDDE